MVPPTMHTAIALYGGKFAKRKLFVNLVESQNRKHYASRNFPAIWYVALLTVIRDDALPLDMCLGKHILEQHPIEVMHVMSYPEK